MTPSPGPVGPTVRRRRSSIAVAVALLAGLGTGSVIAGAGPWAPDAGDHRVEAPITEAVETQVAGISVERSSVDETTITVPPTAAPDTPLPSPVVASPPETAPVTTVPVAPITAPAVSPQEAMRSQVLAAISFPWEDVLPGWRIEFMPTRKGYRGSTFPDRKLIQIYLRSDLTLADYVHVTAHEIGHAVDVALLDAADHERWNKARGRAADADWWVASGADDFSSGAGDWAECFAWSQLPSGAFYSRLGGPPSAEQLQVMADIITG